MTIDRFDERMAELDGHFKNAPTEQGFELPEPGNYQAVFRSVDFFEKKDPPQNLFLKLTFEIVFDAKYAGREVDLIFNMEPQKVNGPPATPEEVEMKLGFLKRDLKTLGVPVEDDDFSLAQVAPGSSIWDATLDCTVELAIRDSKKISPTSGKPFRNVFLNERTGDALPQQSDVPAVTEPAFVPADPASDEDIPF